MSTAGTGSGAAERVASALEGVEHRSVEPRDGATCVEVAPDDVHEALRRLRDRGGFEACTFVTAIDRFPAEPRFDVCYQLLSVRHGARVRVVTRLEEDSAEVSSCTDLWPGASFMERECYDMFGIRFRGHPDLRRLLMPDGYDHHPLRKDFPHQGIEPDRLYREWDRERRARWAAEGTEARS